jgi:hypothetical protein
MTTDGDVAHVLAGVRFPSRVQNFVRGLTPREQTMVRQATQIAVGSSSSMVNTLCPSASFFP